MTQKEFIEILDGKGYSYEIEGDQIIVKGGVYLRYATLKKGDVDLSALTSLPPGVEFRNEGHVYLYDLTSLPPGVEFRNGGDVILYSLTSLPPGVEFKNVGNVDLKSLTGGWFNKWEGNIEGIDNKRLLNLMIKKGMFI